MVDVTGAGARRDSLEFGGGLQEYARKWGPSPLSPPLGALGPVGLRPVSAAPGAETAKYRYRYRTVPVPVPSGSLPVLSPCYFKARATDAES